MFPVLCYFGSGTHTSARPRPTSGHR